MSPKQHASARAAHRRHAAASQFARVTRGLVVTAVVIQQSLSVSAALADQHAPRQVAETFQLRAGYEIELAAAEPLIEDPVSARFDSRGRLWVVEMPDYPTGPPNNSRPSGRIQILTDTDGDGRFDKATAFADGLLFVTGVQPYKSGAFVTLAGEIAFFYDGDDDGVADGKHVLFRGFATENEQLRANHPVLAADGMIYVANGLRGGRIEAVDERFDAAGGPILLHQRDFCFDPDGGRWQAVAGNSQHGLSIDDFGRRIGCSNRNPAICAVLPIEAIERDPLLTPRDALADIAAAANDSSVRPIAQAWTTSNLHAGQFSAACGVLAPGFRHDDAEALYVCEPTGSLVQRQVLTAHGGVWKSAREPQLTEFLAAEDTWFRPVDLIDGVSGEIYVVDMARAVIEHPDWAPPELKSRGDTWDGSGLGRIWRIRKSGSKRQRTRYPDSNAEALRWLQSEIPHRRAVGSQWFLERGLSGSKGELRMLLVDERQPPATRARSALLLKRYQQLTPDEAAILAGCADPRLRSLGIELLNELDPDHPQVFAAAAESDPRVRLSAALAIGSMESTPDIRTNALSKIAAGNTASVWIDRALCSVTAELVEPFTQAALDTAPQRNPPALFLKHLVRRLAGQACCRASDVLVSQLAPSDPASPPSSFQLLLLDAWQQGSPGRACREKTMAESCSSRDALRDLLNAAANVALDNRRSVPDRLVALKIAERSGRVTAPFRQLLQREQPVPVRIAAIPALMRHDANWTQMNLEMAIPRMTHPLKRAVIDAALRSAEQTRWLLTLLSDGLLAKSLVDPATADRLRNHSEPDIRDSALELFRPDEDRLAVLDAYTAAADIKGNARNGKNLFAKHCAACHRINGVGTNVGPDISDSRTKTPSSLLTSILDPNAAIDAAYLRVSILTDQGRGFDGLLLDQREDSVTLALQGGERVTVPREAIERLQTPAVSLMPEGFESVMDVGQMRDLITYLKNWRYLDTDIPREDPSTVSDDSLR